MTTETQVWPAPEYVAAPHEPRALPRDGARPTVTVRTRVMAAVVAMAALGMAVAGSTAFLLQRERVDVLVDDTLSRSVDEFRTLAAVGVDPGTGTGYASVRALLYAALQGTVPEQHEGMFAVLDGELGLVAPPGVTMRLEDAPEVVAAAIAAQDDETVLIRSVATADGSFRYVAVPVSVTGEESTGVLVYGFDRTAEHSELVRTYRTFALVGLGALAVLGVVGWLVAGRLLAPLRLLRDTARRITDSDLSERIAVRGDDDVSELGRTVNSMLDRLEDAFGSQRRLLDDAGHELRTPLTIVRGHLELMDPTDPDDVRGTQELVLDELDRMHRLVDDLVVLATVDRPDFVQPAPTDIGRLTDDVLDKARTLGSRRWLVDGRAEVTVEVDAQRLTQAWLQLAANAVKFSPEGSTVRIGSAVRHHHLELAVHDEGCGVAQEDAERVFDRFARGSVGRGVEGSGLGLPIVRAIARAHGGWARLDTTTTAGARFVIGLPLTAAHDGQTEADL